MTMRSLKLFSLLALGSVVCAGAVRAGDPPSASDVTRLIGQLGSERYADREQAVRDLDGVGVPALDALRKAAQGNDPEVRRRAADLVRKLERRVENDKFLKSARLRLLFKDTPLPEALERFGEATGCELVLQGDKTKFADHKITLDTGELSFWDALDRFCQETGLLEKATTHKPRNNGNAVVQQVIIINGQIYRPEPQEDVPEGRILLTEGKPTPLPTTIVGPVRVRVLPPGTTIPGQPKGEGEYGLVLESAAEPRLRWDKALSVRVRKAVDEHGQELAVVITPPTERSVRASGNSIVIMNGQMMNQDTPSGDPRHLAVRLRVGAKSAKKLTELSGTVSGLVILAPETLATVDGVLKAAGKTIDGVGGSSFKVVEITKDDSGLVKVRAQVEPPASELSDGTAMSFGGTIIINGRMIGGATTPLLAPGYTMLDEKGQAYQLLDTETSQVRAGAPREVRLSFLQKKGQGEPAKLLFTGRRGMVVDVPFTLKDVPLP
jgi:hypothetical protein